ncbi:MFS transporter [Paraburkholderia sp. BCC1885]|uniref:MFS transporter n=1 Tax=Paraburkholderia sp. BCC1885 TaxID=2562669 RepID=UPI0011827CCC|nr:MFS transporter [Paraburkholderia sp. BCC1885]
MEETRVDVAAIKDGSMTFMRYVVVVLCVLIGAVDGYDTLAAAYAAPVMRVALGIAPALLGWVFSIALIGGMFGMLVGGPLADRVGRRPVLIAQVVIFAIFTYLSGRAAGSSELLAYRFAAGFGLGLGITLAYTMVSEFVPTRLRVFAIAMVTIGYSAGAGAGGILASWLIAAYGWRSIFYTGAALAAILALLLIVAMPESFEFLLSSGAPEQRIRKALRRIRPDMFVNHQHIRFIAATSPERKGTVRELFSGDRIAQTLLLWIIFFMNLLELFSIQQWLPTIIHETGIGVQSSVSAGAVLQTGAIVGALAYSRIIDRWGKPFPLFMVLFAVGGLSFVSLGLARGSMIWAMASILALGLCVLGGQIALNGVATIIYPPAIRATGIAWAVSIGRLGGALGPIISGVLLQNRFQPHEILFLGAVPAFIAFAASYLLASNLKTKRREASPAVAR